jgi:hypothetical protein
VSDCFGYDSAIFFWNELWPLWVIRTHHGMSFTTTSLSIGKHGTVIALNHIFN